MNNICAVEVTIRVSGVDGSQKTLEHSALSSFPPISLLEATTSLHHFLGPLYYTVVRAIIDSLDLMKVTTDEP